MGLVESRERMRMMERAEGLLAFEGLGAVEGLWGDSAAVAAVGAGLWLEAVEAALLVDAFPAGEGGGGDGAAGRVGDIVVTAGNLLPQLVFAAGRVLAADEGQDEGIAKESDLGTSILKIGHCGAS
jgi:hypothetical protein